MPRGGSATAKVVSVIYKSPQVPAGQWKAATPGSVRCGRSNKKEWLFELPGTPPKKLLQKKNLDNFATILTKQSSISVIQLCDYLGKWLSFGKFE